MNAAPPFDSLPVEVLSIIGKYTNICDWNDDISTIKECTDEKKEFYLSTDFLNWPIINFRRTCKIFEEIYKDLLQRTNETPPPSLDSFPVEILSLIGEYVDSYEEYFSDLHTIKKYQLGGKAKLLNQDCRYWPVVNFRRTCKIFDEIYKDLLSRINETPF
jgi:hypothetical protein